MAESAHKHGKIAGTVAAPLPEQCYVESFDFVNCGADVAAIGADCGTVMARYAAAAEQPFPRSPASFICPPPDLCR